MRASAVVVAAILAAVSCRRHDDANAPPSTTEDAGDAVATPAAESDQGEVSLDMLEASPRCRIEHRGALVDLGSEETAWATPGHPDPSSELPGFERDGATWGRVLDRSQSFTMAVDATGPALIAVRGRARGAKKAIASLDGKVVGTIVLSPTEDRVVSASNASIAISPGIHTVALRWIGAVAKDEPLAELDWIRLGAVDDDPSAYAAPTRRDSVAEVAIAGAPRRAYVLRAPATIRCVAWIPAGARVVTEVGAIGEGTPGAVEVRERATGSDPPRVVAQHDALSTAWSAISAPLTIGGDSGSIGVVEITVTRAPKQGRVAIAEPRIVRPAAVKTLAADRPTPPSRVVVIVMAGLSTSELSDAVFAKLAKEGVVFASHRAPSSLASASIASLVTGLPVPVHALEDSGARISPRTPLIGAKLSPFGVESAMFTEVPPTGPAFGFAHDWTHFAARSPLDGPPSAIDEVEKFLASAGEKTFVLAHARGAHPPWDVSAEALKTLPPEKYGGMIDPRHVVAILAKVRRGFMHLNENDRTRLLALQSTALATQEARLDAWIDAMRSSGALDHTMLVITSDAAFPIPPATAKPPSVEGDAGAPPPAPSHAPEEDPHAIPLLIRFPNAFGAGHVVTAITDPTDVAATIVAAFGASIADLAGRDLATLALDDASARDAARLLDDGHGYRLAWGDLRLSGAWEKQPILRANGDADDLRTKRPYEYLAAWGLAAVARDRWLNDRAKGPGREPATIDPETAAAMETWERAK